MARPPAGPLTRERFDAVLFDLDGVLTDTARIHAACWKQVFDAYLRERAAREGEPFRPFDAVEDYLRHVDGKPRYDGVRDFLGSRGIRLPEGSPQDPPERETVRGLGNRKDALVERALREGVDPYPGSVALVRRLRGEGLRTAVVSSSSNAGAVLRAAGIETLFDVLVDGRTLARRGLAGKPAPDGFLEAARELGVDAARAAVVEDALSGVEAARAGGFGLVVGVARRGGGEVLKDRGADLVVADLGELA